MKKIILASESPRRIELMQLLGIPFDAVSSGYDEDMALDMPPKKLATFLSRGKAAAVALRYPKHIIIAADTFVVFKNKLLGKPTSRADAARMLRMINNKRISIITGYTVRDTQRKKTITKAVEAYVFMRRYTEAEIRAYIATREPLDKAGAFAVQGYGAVLIKKIDGDFLSIVGLPVAEIAGTLRRLGVRILGK